MRVILVYMGFMYRVWRGIREYAKVEIQRSFIIILITANHEGTHYLRFNMSNNAQSDY